MFNYGCHFKAHEMILYGFIFKSVISVKFNQILCFVKTKCPWYFQTCALTLVG